MVDQFVGLRKMLPLIRQLHSTQAPKFRRVTLLVLLGVHIHGGFLLEVHLEGGEWKATTKELQAVLQMLGKIPAQAPPIPEFPPVFKGVRRVQVHVIS